MAAVCEFGLLPNVNSKLTVVAQTAAFSLNSTVICYASTSTSLVRKVYSSAPPAELSPLSSRTFGTWNLLSTVVRVYAAFHINEPTVYTLALWTYIIAVAHFVAEFFVFKTAGGKGMLAAEMTPVVTIIMMLTQRESYTA